MGYKLNGSPLPIDVAFTDSDGASYPASWLRNSTEEQRAAVPTGGITWEADPPWYDQRFYWGVDKPKNIADTPTYDSYDSDGKGVGDPTGSTPGLKTNWVQKQKDIANSLLAKTDWMVTRKAEAGTAIPTAQANYRIAVRTQCGLREATINACADTDTLCATIRNNLIQTVAGTESNGATEMKKELFDTSKEKKDDSGNSFDPKQYESFDPKQYESYDPKCWNDIANPDLLEDWPTVPS